MSHESKRGDGSSFEVDSQDLHLQAKMRSLRRIDSIRIALTVLALLMGITVLGVSSDTLSVYRNTHAPADLFLPLWPNEFNLQPTIALVVGSSVVTVANMVSLLFSKVPSLRLHTAVHTPLTFAAPLIGLAAAVLAMVYFYAVNASVTDDTLLSWACQWKAVAMEQQPYFGTICKESWAGLYLAILLIPVEAAVLVTAGWLLKAERKNAPVTGGAAKSHGSPTPS